MKLNAFNNVFFLSIYFKNLLIEYIQLYNLKCCSSNFNNNSNNNDTNNNSKLKM